MAEAVDLVILSWRNESKVKDVGQRSHGRTLATTRSLYRQSLNGARCMGVQMQIYRGIMQVRLVQFCLAPLAHPKPRNAFVS